ncbi:MAG: HAD family phosphatase [Pseudomonadota bacterium]|nr:HAD family phosphatase [Pseudomonadota bacterium]
MSEPAARPDTVLFDLGNVLVDWSPRHLYTKVFAGRPRETEYFLTHVVTGAWNVKHDLGKPFQENVAELAARFPWYAREIEAFWSRWPETIGGPIAGTVDLLESLHARDVPLFALTNWSAETFPWAEENLPFLARFGGITVSGRVRVAKPDPAIFELTEREFGLDPARTLFVDDSARNTEVAARRGYHVHTFRDPAGLRDCLGGHGLL